MKIRSDNVIWVSCRHFTPALSEISFKYVECRVSPVSFERVATVIILVMPEKLIHQRTYKTEI